MDITCEIDNQMKPIIKYDQEIIKPRWNFLSKKENILRFANETIIDLLYISIYVFGVDKNISRENFQNCWTRNLVLDVPVYDVKLWQSKKDILIELLSFVSGDKWDFKFRKRNRVIKLKSTVDLRLKKDSISLLSGGLDSFIGAINDFESGNNHLYLSWYGGGKTTRPTQQILKEKLCNKYNCDHTNFEEFYLSFSGSESTTRTRSFFLFVHAIILTFEYKTNNIVLIPENGFISLNVPISEARSGSSSTKTTHPFYMKKFNLLLKELDINVTLMNEYKFKTKGQMINECLNKKFLQENIRFTVSCSHPDTRGKASQGQCGYCWPCIVRRGAIESSFIIDDSKYVLEDEMKKEHYLKIYDRYILENKNRMKYTILKTGNLEISTLEKYSEVAEMGLIEIESVVT